MNSLQNLLENKRIALIVAHPDDNLVHSHALTIARNCNASVQELTLTRGRAGKNLRSKEPSFVTEGLRATENETGAERLGIKAVTSWDYPDGELALHTAELTAKSATWLLRHQVEVLLTMGMLRDHADHEAAAQIAVAAVNQLHAAGIDMITLALQQKSHGTYTAPATDESICAAFESAACHKSQFAIDAKTHKGWTRLNDNLYVHPETYAELGKYSICCDASYDLVPQSSDAFANREVDTVY